MTQGDISFGHGSGPHRMRAAAKNLNDLGSETHQSKSTLHVDDLGGGVGADFLIAQRTKLDLTGNTFRGAVIVAF